MTEAKNFHSELLQPGYALLRCGVTTVMTGKRVNNDSFGAWVERLAGDCGNASTPHRRIGQTRWQYVRCGEERDWGAH